MASICRSLSLFSRTMSKSEVAPAVFRLRSATRSIPKAPRVLSGLEGVESLFPLHSAIASARLKSNIAFDSSCWSLLSLALNMGACIANSCALTQLHLMHRNGRTIVMTGLSGATKMNEMFYI